MIITIPYEGVQQVETAGDKNTIPAGQQIVLQYFGPIVPITITHPQPVIQKLASVGSFVPSIECRALIDTGASCSAITPQVAEALKLIQIGYQMVTSVLEEQERPSYFAFLQFHWGYSKRVQVVTCPLQGVDCLIGRDILMDWNITYNGKVG